MATNSAGRARPSGADLAARGLLGSSGGGAYQYGDADILSRALTGPKVEETFGSITGLMGGDRTIKTGEKVTPRVSMEDVLVQSLRDRQAEIDALQEQRGREERARKDVAGTLNRQTREARETRDALPGKTEAILQQEQAPLKGRIGDMEGLTAEMRPEAQQLAQQNVADVEQKKQEAMASYSDTTAASLQGERVAMRANLDNQVRQIVAQAQQRGMNQNDPAVQDQIRRAREGAAQQLGSIAAQYSTEYNQTLSNLQSSYDQLATQVRQAEATRQTTATQDTFQAMTQTHQLDMQMRELAAQQRIEAEQTRAQLELAADQMEFQGRQWLADWLKDETTFVSPLAPLVAQGYAYQASQAGEQRYKMTTTAAPPSPYGRAGGYDYSPPADPWSRALTPGGRTGSGSGSNPFAGPDGEDPDLSEAAFGQWEKNNPSLKGKITHPQWVRWMKGGAKPSGIP